MATLELKKMQSGQFVLVSNNPDSRWGFEVFDIDGEGSGDPFDFGGNETFTLVEKVQGVEFDPEDTDSFWSAQQEIIQQCKDLHIELPDYVES